MENDKSPEDEYLDFHRKTQKEIDNNYAELSSEQRKRRQGFIDNGINPHEVINCLYILDDLIGGEGCARVVRFDVVGYSAQTLSGEKRIDFFSKHAPFFNDPGFQNELRVFNLLKSSVLSGDIEVLDKDIEFWEFEYIPLTFDGYYRWLEKNRRVVQAYLRPLGRVLPDINDSGKPLQTQSPKEKMWEEILIHGKKYFADPSATTAAFKKDDKTKNILRKYKEDPSVDTFGRRLREAGIITKRDRSKAKK